MRKEEVKVEEKTVEYVYCDECGDECTDEHRIEPIEVCRSCSSDSSYSSMKEFATLSNEEGWQDFGIMGALLGALLWPLLIVGVWADEKESKQTLYVAAVTALWTIFGLIVIASLM